MAPHRHLPGRPHRHAGAARPEGRLVHVEGKLQTRRWKKDGEGSNRFSTEILVVPGHRLQFLDKPNGVNGEKVTAEPADGETAPATNGGADDFDDSIPF